MTLIVHAERAHAKLSASGAHRWMNCPGSVRLEEAFPDTSSAYADEGTLAHEFVEWEMIKRFKLRPDLTPQKITAEVGKLKKKEHYAPEMLTHATAFVDKIQTLADENKGIVMSETKFDLTDYIPEGFGTCDAAIIGLEELVVADFKYGRGVKVDVDGNEQLLIYALGAYSKFACIAGFSKVRIIIIQPRIDGGYSEAVVTVEELLAFGERVKQAASKAFYENGEVIPGEHCRWCKAKAVCKARADQNIALAGFTKVKAETLTVEELSEFYKKGRDVAKWLSDLQAHMEALLLSGKQVPGWKMVEGRSNRTWTDQELAFEAILNKKLLEEPMLYERKPITLAGAEKLIGKEKFATEMASFIDKPAGKPTMVEATDKRTALNFNPFDVIDNKESES